MLKKCISHCFVYISWSYVLVDMFLVDTLVWNSFSALSCVVIAILKNRLFEMTEIAQFHLLPHCDLFIFSSSSRFRQFTTSIDLKILFPAFPLSSSKRRHLYVVETTACPSKAESYDGGSFAAGRANLVGQVKADGPDEACPKLRGGRNPTITDRHPHYFFCK